MQNLDDIKSEPASRDAIVEQGRSPYWGFTVGLLIALSMLLPLALLCVVLDYSSRLLEFLNPTTFAKALAFLLPLILVLGLSKRPSVFGGFVTGVIFLPSIGALTIHTLVGALLWLDYFTDCLRFMSAPLGVPGPPREIRRAHSLPIIREWTVSVFIETAIFISLICSSFCPAESRKWRNKIFWQDLLRSIAAKLPVALVRPIASKTDAAVEHNLRPITRFLGLFLLFFVSSHMLMLFPILTVGGISSYSLFGLIACTALVGAKWGTSYAIIAYALVVVSALGGSSRETIYVVAIIATLIGLRVRRGKRSTLREP